MNATTVTASRANNYLGLPVTGEWLVTLYTENTRRGVGRQLFTAMREWAKWFRASGASSIKLVTKRPQYHYGHNSSMILGTYLTVRVVCS